MDGGAVCGGLGRCSVSWEGVMVASVYDSGSPGGFNAGLERDAGECNAYLGSSTDAQGWYEYNCSQPREAAPYVSCGHIMLLFSTPTFKVAPLRPVSLMHFVAQTATRHLAPLASVVADMQILSSAPCGPSLPASRRSHSAIRCLGLPHSGHVATV